MPYKKLKPRQPDPFIIKPPDQELAKFGHLNAIIGYINDLLTLITSGSGTPVKFNLTATTDPTVNDDSSLGYSINSIWFNTVTQTFWANLDASLGAAVWSDQVIGGTGLLNNMTAITAPTANDDSGDGYSINSGWFNTITGILYFAQDVTPGAAVWLAVPTSSTGLLILRNCAFVAKNGGDLTAALDNLGQPYLTIAAARTAALAAITATPTKTFTIFVFPGDYVEATGIVLSEGIDYVFMGEGTLTVGAGAATFLPVSNTTISIYAPEWTFPHTTGRYVLQTVGITGANISFRFKAVTGTAYPNFFLNSAVRTYLKGEYAYSSAGWANVYGETNLGGAGSASFIEIDRMEVAAVDARNFDLQEGSVYVYNKQALSPNGGCIYVQAHNAGCEMFFHMQEILCTNGGVWPVWFDGTGTNMFIDFDSITSPSDCHIISGGGGTVHAKGAKVISTRVGTQDGILHAETGASLYVYDVTILRAATAVGGGDIKLSGLTSHLYLKNVSYDVTLYNNAGVAANFHVWNGTSWGTAPEIRNNPVSSGNTVTNCTLDAGTIIDFANFTGCSLNKVSSIGPTTFTATGNGYVEADSSWVSGRRVETMVDIGWVALLNLRLTQTLEPATVYHVIGTGPDPIDTSTVITQVYLRADSINVLENTGYGVYVVGAITAGSCQVTFDFNQIAGNRMRRVVTEYNADIIHYSPTIIDRWLTATAAVTNITVRYGFITAGPYGTIGSNSRFLGEFVSITIPFGATFSGEIFSSGQGDGNIELIMASGQSLLDCYLSGSWGTIDLTTLSGTYAQISKRLSSGFSNFVVTPTDHASVNPTAGGVIDMSDFPWAGILTPTSAANVLHTITQNASNPYASALLADLIIAPTVDGFTINNSGNIDLGQSPTVLNGATEFDSLVLWSPPNTTAIAQKNSAGGTSGYSGYSGTSGFSGANPGASGYSGYSGVSGFSGDNPGSSGYSGYSGIGQWANQDGALNPSGDTVNINAGSTSVLIQDGSTDVTINLPNPPTGDGWQLTIIFFSGSAAVTWGGGTIFPGAATFFNPFGQITFIWNSGFNGWLTP